MGRRRLAGDRRVPTMAGFIGIVGMGRGGRPALVTSQCRHPISDTSHPGQRLWVASGSRLGQLRAATWPSTRWRFPRQMPIAPGTPIARLPLARLAARRINAKHATVRDDRFRISSPARTLERQPGVRKVYPSGKCLSQHKTFNRSNIRVRDIYDDHHRTGITMDGQPGQDDGEGAGRDRDPEPPPRPPAVRSRIRPRPVPTRGWRSSRGTTRGRARRRRARWRCWSTSCQGRSGAAREPPATSWSGCCGRGRRSSRGPRAPSSA